MSSNNTNVTALVFEFWEKNQKLLEIKKKSIRRTKDRRMTTTNRAFMTFSFSCNLLIFFAGFHFLSRKKIARESQS